MDLACNLKRFENLKTIALAQRRTPRRLPATTFFLDAYLANLEASPILREALALESKWAQQPLEILPGELLLGLPYTERFDLCAGHGLQLRHEGLRAGAFASAAERHLQARLRLAGRLVTQERIRQRLTPKQRQAQACGLAASQFWGGHQVPDFEMVLHKGLRGLGAGIEDRRCQTPELDAELHQALVVSVRAITTLILRYSQEARRQAELERLPERARELQTLAECCAHIASEPPRTFYEALQLTWFIHLVTDCDSFGRLDQYLWPFYERDLAAGVLMREQAGYLIKALWLKVLISGGIPNLTLGGCTPEGEDATNDLTLLCLEATRDLELPQPNLSLRVGVNPPETLLTLAAETISHGLGLPALYNDRVIIPALLALGIAPADANNYALAGCSQVVIPGKSHFGCDDGMLNVAKCLELALNNGRDPLTGKLVGLETGTAETLRDFAGLLAAFKRQVWHSAALLGSVLNASDQGYAENCGYPIRTLLTQDCLEQGKGIWQGGARYNAIQAECVGITTVADALAAIKAIVYEDRAIGLPVLVEMLRRNWRGHEAVRLYCLNRLPKFGNDDEFVDALYADIAKTAYSAVRQQVCRRGGIIMPGSAVFTYHLEYGAKTGATADGRQRGAPLADSAGPAQGQAHKGPTAILHSMVRFDQSLAPTCVALNLMFDRSAFQPAQLVAMVRTYFAQGGMQMQINVADKDLLRRAQKRPQEHPDLCVRVGGFSAYFVELERAVQDEIISRTAH